MKKGLTLSELLISVIFIFLLILVLLLAGSGSFDKTNEITSQEPNKQSRMILLNSLTLTAFENVYVIKDSITNQEYIIVSSNKSICITPSLPTQHSLPKNSTD